MTVRLWDPDSGAVVAILQGDRHSLKTVTFSPTGEQLVFASNKLVRLWDPDSGAVLATLEGHSNGIISVVFSPNGKQLASVSLDGTVRLWDLSSGRPLIMIKERCLGSNSITFSPNGEELLCSSFSRITLWATNSGACLWKAERRPINPGAVAFSLNGRQLAYLSDLVFTLLDRKSGRKRSVQIPGASPPIKSLLPRHCYISFSPNGKLLALSNSWSTLLCDVGSGAVLKEFRSNTNPRGPIAFSPTGKQLAFTSLCVVEPWDID